MNIENLVRKSIKEMEIAEYAPSKHEKYKADLSLIINPLGVSKKVMDKLAKLDSKTISHYYPENPVLVDKISEYTGMNHEEILLGDGCDGCLAMIANTFIEDGDEVLIPTPTFHRYEFHTRCMGGKPVFIQTRDFQINDNDILENVNKKTKLIFLCDPNNPTGLLIDEKTKINILNKFNGIVVIDEALADMVGMNSLPLIKKYNNLIITRSFSKIFGLASLRIGYIIANKELIAQIRKTSSPHKVNGIAQELAIEALNDKEYLANSIEFIERNRKFLIENLEKLGLKCTNSVTSNFLLDISPLKMDSTEFVSLLKTRGIAVTDGKPFKVPNNCYVRISVGTEEENKYFIDIMKAIVEGKNQIS